MVDQVAQRNLTSAIQEISRCKSHLINLVHRYYPIGTTLKYRPKSHTRSVTGIIESYGGEENPTRVIINCAGRQKHFDALDDIDRIKVIIPVSTRTKRSDSGADEDVRVAADQMARLLRGNPPGMQRTLRG
jgi:hypothetical protein